MVACLGSAYVCVCVRACVRACVVPLVSESSLRGEAEICCSDLMCEHF